jgi:hypothetical protein
MSQNSAKDASPSQDIGSPADLKPPAATTNNDDRTKQGNGNNNGDECDLYTSQTTTKEPTMAETLPENSTNSSVTMIGPCYFNLP